MTAYLIEGGRALLPSGLEEAAIRVEDGRIVEIGAPPRDGALRIDAAGLIVAPAMVDIHGDAFERQVMPRPGVTFPLDVALTDTDRQLAANGIATAYHALTLSWEPGLRSVEHSADFIAALDAHRPRLSVDHRLQLRWETFAFEAIPVIERALASPATPSVAFNDHTSMNFRPIGMPVTERAFEHSPEFQIGDLDDPRIAKRFDTAIKRSGLDAEAFMALQREIWERRPDVPDQIAAVAACGRAAGAPMLSHDDSQMETRRFFRALGAGIAEFPMKRRIAEDARIHGEAVVLGAPNVVRGGSHIGSLSGAEMVEAGLCDVLASDYYYPAMLAAAGRLLAERRADLPTVWAAVSSGPARASKLDDRGTLEIGKRADIVALDWPDQATPSVAVTLSGGRIAHLTGDRLR